MSSRTHQQGQSTMLNNFLNQILIFPLSRLGGPLWVASCRQHISRIGNGQKKKNASGGKAFQFQQNALRVFLFLSRTCLRTQSGECCWLTANSNCPGAIGSHFQTGSFIFPWKRKWSLALILNHPPAAVYKVIRETGWQTHTCPHWDAEIRQVHERQVHYNL